MTRMIRSIARYLASGPIEMNSLEDAAALARYAAHRDPRAFEVLVLRYQAMVVHTCRRVMASQADAEDAAQETFLKLARRAGEIRSNVAAWLHACALRTSVDLLRSQASRVRAESAAAEPAPADDTEKTWREIKPLLDDAIAALDEADRELIVTRFLAGRSQIDMAREARVNPGTMHRRIDAALDRLRVQLARRGVTPAIGASIGAGAGLGALTPNAAVAAALGHAGAGSSPALLTPVLVSVGLADMGGGVAAGSAGGKLLSIVLASFVGAGVLGGGMYLAGSGLFMSAAPRTANPGGFDRPKQVTPGARLVSQSSGDKPDGSIAHEGEVIHVLFHKKADGRPQNVVMKILSFNGDASLDTAGRARGKMRVRFDGWDVGREYMHEQLLGKERDADYDVDGDLFTLTVRLDVQVPPPPAGQPQTETVPEEVKIVVARAKQPDPQAPVAKIPAIAGTWEFINDCKLQMDTEFITLSWIQDDGSAFPGLKFRVLEWENAGDSSKVQTIVTASAMDQSMVGKRVKVLARRDATGWTLVWHDPKTNKQNQWPAGFDAKPGEVVRFVFQEGGR